MENKQINIIDNDKMNRAYNAMKRAQRNYYLKNRARRIEQAKTWNTEHKETYTTYARQYYRLNKERLNNKVFHCEACNKNVKSYSKSAHLKGEKHLKNVNNNNVLMVEV
jgi:hypothetical protein